MQPSRDPNNLEFIERWLARQENDLSKLADEFRKHIEHPGHSGETDLRARLNRMEMGFVATILGLLADLLSRFFSKT